MTILFFPQESFCPPLHSFLSNFLQKLEWVLCVYSLLWGNSLVSLRRAIPSLGILGYHDQLLSLALAPLLSPETSVGKRRKVEEGGNWSRGGLQSLEGICSGLLVAWVPLTSPSPRAPALDTWPNLFTLAVRALSLLTPHTSPQ